MRIVHSIEPVFDERSRVLVLGSFPSIKSREVKFFYGNPQNRFWKVLAMIKEEPVPETTKEKKEFLLRNRIALWDVIAECDIEGSSDSSIKNVKVNDLRRILDVAEIDQIYCNGTKAWALYNRYIKPLLGREAVKLPSTSPANAAWPLDKLAAAWKEAF